MSEDLVNHPKHYTSGQIEVIDFIEDQRLGFHLGNCVKYISRAGKKLGADTTQDLEKAAWYLNREIKRRTTAGCLPPVYDGALRQQSGPWIDNNPSWLPNSGTMTDPGEK